MTYNDVVNREEWLSSSQQHRRIPALVHLAMDHKAWSTGTLYNEAIKQGYRMSYSSFQRDIEFCEAMGIMNADKGQWMAGRSTLISVKDGAREVLERAKIPCVPSRRLRTIPPRKI
jgi:ABC-type protease/lipase transport system fused ATPase/permease subunit